MSENRPHIPWELQRQLMMECGHRCAVCKTPEPLEFEHIEEWSEVKGHTFENMIVLCPNCHSRKSSNANPKSLDKITLRKIKNNLFMMNARYSDIEKRVIETYCENNFPKALDAKFQFRQEDIISLMYLKKDGIIKFNVLKAAFETIVIGHGRVTSDIVFVSLTEKGKQFVQDICSIGA